MEQNILELVNLKKSIRGKPIVKGVNLTLKPSEIFGFLGPNGAGKTTTIRMIVGLIKPTEGNIKICGHSLSKDFVNAMSNVGCIIESPDMYKFMSGLENLRQFAAMDKRVTSARIEEVIKLVGLEHRIKDKVSIYSLGMRQRLGIAQAILTNPRLLILDEPTNGLDPSGINEFRNLIRKLAYEYGMAVFISSHLLSEVEQMCDRIAIIKQGEVVKITDVQEILNNNIVQWELDSPDKAITCLKEKANINAKLVKKNLITAIIGDKSVEEINLALFNQGINFKYCYSKQNTLEDLFLEITEGDEIV